MDKPMEYGHKPVLLEECLRGLNIRPEGVLAAAVALAGGVCGAAGGKKKRKKQRHSTHR